ncbi:MAG: rod shape-determining protein [Lachnospiraceae bacterium]|nr:rod shape-determining protein [Ruminococcus sp.]MCM1274239.1 rod shape-determining protein [Lachnospiraceae bacterium]
MALDIGIDLGTANIIITVAGKGITLNEPSVVAYDKKKKAVVAVGSEAYKMIGRTPEYIVAVRPLKDGVISDNDMTQAMIKEFINIVNGGFMVKPRIVLCVPSSVTDVERRAVVEAALSAGARKVYLIEEPIAALIGAGIDISKPNGTMVVDIGGGTSDVAIVSFNGIVQSRSVKMAGNKMDAALIRHITQKYKILIGEKTAEKAKMELTNVFRPSGLKKMTVRGRHLLKGLPESVEISDVDTYEALHENAMEIVEQIKLVLESTPPELVGDILSNGILLTGGGALLGGLPELITDRVGAPCFIADNPIECVARGVDEAFRMSDSLLDGFEQVQLYGFH